MHTYIQTCIHTCMHAYIHTYIHVCVYVCVCVCNAREHFVYIAQVALRAVRGGGESLGLRTPPISGSSTPFSSSRTSSPGSSPRYAYVGIRQHTSAYVYYAFSSSRTSSPGSSPRYAYVGIRQHTSAYVSIRILCLL
jgi:hypothetical protein